MNEQLALHAVQAMSQEAIDRMREGEYSVTPDADVALQLDQMFFNNTVDVNNSNVPQEVIDRMHEDEHRTPQSSTELFAAAQQRTKFNSFNQSLRAPQCTVCIHRHTRHYAYTVKVGSFGCVTWPRDVC